MSIIYVVTSGCYSAYQINAVFDNKEMAEQYVETYNRILRTRNCLSEEYVAQIEEYELNEKIIDHAARNEKHYSIKMLKDGTVFEIFEEKRDVSFGEEASPRFVLSPLNSELENDEYYLFANLYATNQALAIKITNEMRVMMLAEDLWRPDASDRWTSRGDGEAQ